MFATTVSSRCRPCRQPLAALLIFLSLFMAGCDETKNDLFDYVLDYERGLGQLVVDEINVAGLNITFLRSERFNPPRRSIDVDEQSAALDRENEALKDTTPREVLVLLHGFGGDKDNWVRLAAELGQQYTLIIPDLPGHGESSKDLALSYDLPQQVTRLRNFLRSLGLTNFHLAGNSMGGAIASLYAAQYPDQVETLTLFNPAGIYEVESDFIKGLGEGNNALIIGSPEEFDELIGYAMADPPFIPWPLKSVMAERAAAQQEVLEKIYADLTPEEPNYEFRDIIRNIRSPTLVLWGALDRVIAQGNAEAFTLLIPNARKFIFEDAGHMPMLERPEKSAELMTSFIVNQARVAPAPAP
ncbi:alpha/beta fold hydrolase [Allohahella marinimesophila]|uniref:AB hydrolase-1 domain-containing protein n=1 Tax=Allohahella marinimesophila TaxID=1054972 RepID=A0ABP7P963_9GAMM